MTARPSEPPDWERALAADTRPSGGYQSPLLARMSQQRLTVAMLREEIPIVRDGEAAAERLAKPTGRTSAATRARLAAQAQAGQDAKERLFAAALPLIRTVATREWHRRQQWGSQVPLEDLLQEAIVGFLKGISSFRVEAIGRSATNYLGQWMLVETRRAAEVLDHDLQVGHDAGERFRRVRALRGRLASELDRDPTDEEISAASRDPRYVTRPGLVGRVPHDGGAPPPGKGLTVQQVADERVMRARVGRAARFSAADDADEASVGPGLVDPSRLLAPQRPGLPLPADSPEDHVAAADAARVVAGILAATLDRLALPAEQREVIARRFGLPPHQEASAREIARALGLQRDRVSRILAAFQHEMVRPGGSFHAVVRTLDPDEVRDIGLGWALDALGDWPDGPTAPPPDILVRPAADRPAAGPPTVAPSGVVAWFVCDYHDRSFSLLYPDRSAVPRQQPCPACQRPSERLKILAAPPG